MNDTQEADERTEIECVMVQGERVDDGVYRLCLLPVDNSDFRSADEWIELKTSWLKVNGVGFSADGFEFSEHGETITVTQEIPGGSARINW